MGCDISNRLGVDHQCARQMDRQTEMALAVAQSNDPR